MGSTAIKHGDFTGLAENYSKYRPAYSLSVRDALLALVKKPASQVDAADVGAGTGIWSRIMAECVRRVTAVEPNDDMRRMGMADSAGLRVEFRSGSGEATGLGDGTVDLVTMASSFHWVDFDKGLREFHRILRPGGRFVALWNPRMVELNPLLTDIEAEISRLNPAIKRVSSGHSGVTATLTERLWDSKIFGDVVYVEGRHTSTQTPAEYIGAWKSVNDVRVQLGPEKWEQFLAHVEKRTAGLDTITTTYATRAWSAARL